MTDDCPICGFDGAERSNHADASFFNCRRCGRFWITGTAEAVATATQADGRSVANASGWIRENPDTRIGARELESLWQLRTPTVADRATKLLRELERRYPNVGETFDFAFPDLGTTDPSWLAVTWSESIEEVQYLLLSYLRGSKGAVGGEPHGSDDGVALMDGHITPDGHEILEQLRSGNPKSPIGFCAMSFADDLKGLWLEAIEPAIRLAGYDPKRIDQHEHVNRIDDEIVAMIRRSRFVVADFTGQRGGVYFEAGFALGLGLPVIWLCREEEVSGGLLHFDTRQYNFLLWKPGEYADLAKRLQKRIEAILGVGPIKSTASAK